MGTSGGNLWAERKEPGRMDTKESPEKGGQALNSTNSSHYSHFPDEESETQRSLTCHMPARERQAWGGPSVPG